jgi:hypothetical protein
MIGLFEQILGTSIRLMGCIHYTKVNDILKLLDWSFYAKTRLRGGSAHAPLISLKYTRRKCPLLSTSCELKYN